MKKEELLSKLPSGFIHELAHFEEHQDGCKATIRCNCSSEEDFAKWIVDYEKLSLTSWIVRRTYKPEMRLCYRKDFVCRLSDYSHKKTTSHRCLARSCSASIAAKVKIDSKKTRRTDPYVKIGLCGVIELNAVHSHPIENAHALSLLRPSAEVRSRFTELFRQGHSVKEAIKEYRRGIELQFGDDEAFMAASNIVPPENTVWYWYSSWQKENTGVRDSIGRKTALEEKLSQFEKNGAIVKAQKNPFAIVVVTPIMQRAHRLPSSEEIAFVDSTSLGDDGHHVLTFFFVKCPIGAVPIGVVITNGTSPNHYRSGFSLLRDAIGPAGFNGRKEPKIFMTDDNEAERNALGAVWPNSHRFLCLFHVCDTVWRWLRSADNKIHASDRKILLQEFRAIVYAMTVEESEEKFRYAYFFSAVGQRYPNWLAYILSCWKRREAWCVAHRKEPAVRGSNTTSYINVAIRMVKSIVLSGTKAFNSVALVDFIASGMEKYFEKRILRFALSRDTRNHLLLESVLKESADIVENDIVQLDENFYSVKSLSTPGEYYCVDVVSGSCTCSAGTFGAFCKHQAALFRLNRIRLPSLPASTGSDRHMMAILARGNAAKSADFYRGLDEEIDTSIDNGINAIQVEKVAVSAVQSGVDITESVAHAFDVDELSVVAEPKMDLAEVDSLSEEIYRKLSSALKNGWSDKNIVAGANAFLARLSKLKTTAQLAASLHAFAAPDGMSSSGDEVAHIVSSAIQRSRSGRILSGQPPSKKKKCC